MPAYPIPPWLRPPPDPGEEYVQAFHSGAAIAGQQAQLQAQAAQAQQQHEMEKQRLEISKQQAQLEFGLKHQQLQQDQQLLQMKTQEAARKFQAHQTFKQLVGGGMDPAQALLQVGPDLGISMVGAAQLYKATQPQKPPAWIPANVQTGEPGHWLEAGKVQIPKEAAEGTMSQVNAKRLADLQKLRADAEKADIPISEGKKAAKTGETAFEATERLRQEKVAGYQAQIDAILSGGNQAVPPPAAGAPSVPAPAAGPKTTSSGHRVVSIVQGGASAAPAATAAAPAAAPLPANIPGLRGPQQGPTAAPTKDLAGIQRRNAERRVADVREEYDRLKSANTGKGTFMGADEYNRRYAQLAAALQTLSPEERQSIIGQ